MKEQSQGNNGRVKEEAGPRTGKNEKPLFLVRDERLIFTDVSETK